VAKAFTVTEMDPVVEVDMGLKERIDRLNDYVYTLKEGSSIDCFLNDHFYGLSSLVYDFIPWKVAPCDVIGKICELNGSGSRVYGGLQHYLYCWSIETLGVNEASTNWYTLTPLINEITVYVALSHLYYLR
jgi:hypothetical protein